jgi:hypothetical protein
VEWIVEGADNDSVTFAIFYINGDSVFTHSHTPYKFDWITNTVADQPYALSVKIFDLSGNSTILGPVTVIVDNIPAPDTTPPSGNITYPPSGSTVSGTVTIKVSAYDDTWVEYYSYTQIGDSVISALLFEYAIDQVQFSIDGTEIIPADTSEPYQYTWDTTTETDQTDHFISATIIDNAGNVTVLSTISVFVNNLGDGIGPTVNIISPASNQIVSNDVVITASAYDESGVKRVEFYQNGSITETDTEAPYTYTWNTNEENDDSDHIWAVTAFDSNEYSTQSQSIILHVDNDDNIDPSGSILYPYAGQHLSGEVEIQVSANDNQGVSSVEFSITSLNNSIDGTMDYNDISDTYSYIWNTTEAAEDEQHFIQVSIQDLFGNTAVLNMAVFIDNDLNDTTPPVVSIRSPVSGDNVSGIVTISAFASDNVGVEVVKFFIDDPLILADTVTTATENLYSYSWDTSSLTNGDEHSIHVSAVDLAGNETYAQPILVTIDNGN